MRSPLHVQQLSLQFTDTQHQFVEDVMAALRRGADLIGVTETSSPVRKRVLRKMALDAGYRPHVPMTGSTAVLVGPSLRVVSQHQHFVNPAVNKPPREGGHAARYITAVQVEWENEQVWFGEAHWVTGFGGHPRRTREHELMTRRMVDEVRRHGAGTKLAFFAGDTNFDDGAERRIAGCPPLLFDQAGVSTIWEELDRFPDTHGRKTLDVIGSYDRDRRVSAVDVRMWPRGHSDHRAVSAFYEVKPRKTRK